MSHYQRLSHHVAAPSYLVYTFGKLKRVSHKDTDMANAVFGGVEVGVLEAPAKADAMPKRSALHSHRSRRPSVLRDPPGATARGDFAEEKELLPAW